jgi:hypothetical protein
MDTNSAYGDKGPACEPGSYYNGRLTPSAEGGRIRPAYDCGTGGNDANRSAERQTQPAHAAGPRSQPTGGSSYKAANHSRMRWIPRSISPAEVA